MIQGSRCILFSFAHPDDESFLAAGVACRYAAEGVCVVLLTATRGAAGKVGNPAVCSKQELAAVREAELRAAAQILGVQHVHVLDYPDRELAAVPAGAIREQLVRLIRRHQPQIVVSFDPNGSNLHPDHVAISRFTSDAVAAAADERWFPGAGDAHLVRRLLWTTPLRAWEVGRAQDLEAHPGIDFVIDTGSWWQRKAEALRAHRTQHQSTERHFLSQPGAEQLLSIETFRQAWGPALSRRPVHDLFDGI